MAAERKPELSVSAAAIVSVPSMRPEPVPPMERWICDGWDTRGRRCGQVLMSLSLVQGVIVVRCRKCGTWHTRSAS